MSFLLGENMGASIFTPGFTYATTFCIHYESLTLVVIKWSSSGQQDPAMWASITKIGYPIERNTRGHYENNGTISEREQFYVTYD